jgi:hypothetical protein
MTNKQTDTNLRVQELKTIMRLVREDSIVYKVIETRLKLLES